MNAASAESGLELAVPVLDLPALVIDGCDLGGGRLFVIGKGGDEPERFGPRAAVRCLDRDGVFDVFDVFNDPDEVAVRCPSKAAAVCSGDAAPPVLSRGGHDGRQERPVRQDLDRGEHQVLLDPPQHVGSGRSDHAPQFVAGEVPVGQQEHARVKRVQEPARELVLAGLGDTVKGGIDQRVGAAFDQRQQPDLWISALCDSELGRVLGGVSRIQAGAVPSDQAQPERESALRARSGQWPAPPIEQQPKGAWTRAAAWPWSVPNWSATPAHADAVGRW
ncbi:hypothetical protein B0I32_14050 [Nonomuraea fuscirosea]|uniref:Uncharacterized protein n=1 Tax=Nonomuraea fuscirosea TaxID=1291556 RepID=A0A2T0LXQ5_9ACTN|nr:hypothetical protein B0I32_14050 [Nonomuraea fuscirosea]